MRSLQLLWLVLAGSVWSQVTMMGGKGQLRLFDAENSFPGHLYVNGLYSLFLEKHDYPPTDGKGDTRSVLVKDNTFNLSLTLGISKGVELFIHTVPYQDNQKDLWGPIGDTRCGLKVHIPNQGAAMQIGMAGYVQIPTAPHHPLPYEPYAADAYGWTMLGILNLDLKNTGQALPLKFSLNLGYRDMDWRDQYFADQEDQLVAGIGCKFPIRSYQFYSEVTGDIFINHSDITLRQNFIRFSQGVRFLGYKNFIFDLAGDFRLTGYRPTSAEVGRNALLQRYADWKILLGASYRTTLFTRLTPEEKKARALQAEEKKKLDEIRKKREKVAQEMEELKKSIENEKKEKQPF